MFPWCGKQVVISDHNRLSDEQSLIAWTKTKESQGDEDRDNSWAAAAAVPAASVIEAMKANEGNEEVERRISDGTFVQGQFISRMIATNRSPHCL